MTLQPIVQSAFPHIPGQANPSRDMQLAGDAGRGDIATIRVSVTGSFALPQTPVCFGVRRALFIARRPSHQNFPYFR
jgi:hypothetical protein